MSTMQNSVMLIGRPGVEPEMDCCVEQRRRACDKSRQERKTDCH